MWVLKEFENGRELGVSTIPLYIDDANKYSAMLDKLDHPIQLETHLSAPIL
jgi:hypothetical protein